MTPELTRLPTVFPYFRAMIAYLKGDFVHKNPAVVHVEVNGVGYEVQISLNTYSKIQNLEKGILHTASDDPGGCSYFIWFF